MHKIAVKRCLWCWTLKRGSQVWGMFHMGFCFAVIIIAITCMLYSETTHQMYFFTPAIIGCSLYTLFDLFLLIGLSKDHLNLILAWLIWNGSIALCLLWYIGFILIILIFTQPMMVLGTIAPIVYLSIEVYFVVVVVSYYIELKYPPGSVLYNPPSRRARPETASTTS